MSIRGQACQSNNALAMLFASFRVACLFRTTERTCTVFGIPLSQGKALLSLYNKVNISALVTCKYAQFEGIERRQELFQPRDAVQLLSAKVDAEQVLPVW